MIKFYSKTFYLIAILICLAVSGCQSLQIGKSKKCSSTVSDLARDYSFVNSKWKLFNAKDAKGNSWNNSSLVFLSQETKKNKQFLKGYFDWYSNGTQFGREHFSGYFLINTGELVLQGDPIKKRKDIKASKYQAVLCSDGKTISRGKWSAANVIPGEWSASLVDKKDQINKGSSNRLYTL